MHPTAYDPGELGDHPEDVVRTSWTVREYMLFGHNMQREGWSLMPAAERNARERIQESLN